MVKSNSDHGKMKKIQWLRWIGTVASAVLFLRLMFKQNWVDIWHHLQRLPFWVLPAALLFYIIGMLANAVRWYILLRTADIHLPFGVVARIVFTGAFVSNFLPSTIGGDTVRFVGLVHYTKERTVSLASVVVDRLVNMSAFVTVLPLAVITFGDPASWPRVIPQADSFLPFVMLAGVKPSWAVHLISRLRSWTDRGLQAARIWLKQPYALFLAFCISWLSIFVVFLAIWLVGRGLDIPVALYQVMGVTVITYFLTLLPISVNGYGLREVAITALYLPLGASLEQAAILAIITRFLSMLATIPGALWLSQVVAGPLRNAEIESGEPPMATQED